MFFGGGTHGYLLFKNITKLISFYHRGTFLGLLKTCCFQDVLVMLNVMVIAKNKINIYRQSGGPVINAVPCATSKQGLHPDWRTVTAAPPASTG